MDYNGKLVATWHTSRYGNIYRKYYLIFNGSVFNLEIYSNGTNYINLNATPTYLDADFQLFLKGRCGLADIEPIDYVHYKKVYSGV